MRITPTRVVYVIILIVLLTCLIHLMVSNGKSQRFSCSTSPAFQAQLNDLAYKIHSALKSIGVTHFICGESLWAGLYNQGARNWDHNVEVCLLDRDLKKSNEDLKLSFLRNDLLLDYDYVEGTFNVRMPKTHPSVQALEPDERDVTATLVIFESVDSKPSMLMRRKGWKRSFLPADCEISSLQCFPTFLAKSPLPTLRFGSEMVPVPREGIEIQKYHYPDDWWLQRKAPPC